MRATVVGVCVVLAVAGIPGAARPDGVVLEVAAGPQAREATPVVFPRPAALAGARSLRLEDLEDHATVGVQPVEGEPGGLAFVVRDLPAGATRRYRLTAAGAPWAGRTVACRDDGGAVTLLVDGRSVLTYHAATVDPPRGFDPVYRRSGFIHPLVTPSGRVVTADFPADHAHQHGLFFAWVNTTFAGHKVDFWNQKEGTGRVRHLDGPETESGPAFGQLRARLRHEDITGKAAPVPALDEEWVVRVYDVGRVRIVDLESRQSCAGARPLDINKYHYGGFGLRGTTAWFDPKAQGESPPDPARCGESNFLTSEGRTRADGNHTRPRWVDLYGRLDGQFAGVAIFDHPANFRFPQPVRLHPNKPYFCFAPMVEGAFRVEPGRAYVSRYRLVLHDGKPDPKALDALWRDFAEPPAVRAVAAD